MSGGPACQCQEASKPLREREWRVNQRQCNHSAFNGWRTTFSRYSEVQCTYCNAIWRTKAAYVSLLRDR